MLPFRIRTQLPWNLPEPQNAGVCQRIVSFLTEAQKVALLPGESEKLLEPQWPCMFPAAGGGLAVACRVQRNSF